MEPHFIIYIIFFSFLFIGSHLFLYFIFKKNTVQKSEYDILKVELQNKSDKNTLLEKSISSTEAEKISIEKQFNQLMIECDSLKSAIINEKQNVFTLDKKNALLQKEKDDLNERMKQHNTDLDKIQEKFKLEFENISNKILTNQSEHFKNTSKDSIHHLITPLLTDLKNINQALLEEGKAKASLEGAIKQIISSNQTISEQSEKLTNALKGNTKLQGNWGEMMLEKILEESGLRKDTDYVLQGKQMDLINPNDEHKIVKPDVIVNLPENKHIIIDSKITLVDYERYYSEPNELQRKTHLDRFMKSIQRHIDDLSSKRYQDIQNLKAPDFTIMFLGIDSAYALAIQTDQTLLSYAWAKKIVLVNSSTLFATLKTISSVWRLEMQNQNAIEIASQGGKLYDKLVSFVEDMKELEKKINSLNDCHSSAMKKLSEGRGNLIKKAEYLKSLGVKASKSFPLEVLTKHDSEDAI